jgi:hypothetical protein
MKMHSGRLIGGTLVAAAILASVTMTAAQARDFHFFVSGSGTTQDPDRRTALDEAYDKASEQARLVCAGGNGQIRHDRIDRTGSSCLRSGDGDNAMYSCMVFVRADCVSRVR